ncbi:uncharacterized protein LOC132313647 isoform X1 [Cornus florida]|uniref:uncharacterized protein LOC132313647 isoform X1 n=1 Tax=Cornus florida TaxID=4283 RepID=UPI0028A008B2|nr:uncharacterized protein LOC132313647 isoform X1 [Cornus florida]XP_059668501.1 uncharacterized protein LOC132313647 isoform X1 [Cornus florida]
MFQMYAGSINIDIFLEVHEIDEHLTVIRDDNVDENEAIHNVSPQNGSGQEKGVENATAEDMNSDESDEDYVFSGDNEDEIYIVVDPVHLEVESLDDDGDSRLSDYNSNDSEGNFSDSSLEIEGKTVNIHKYIKGKRFRYGDNGKIELEKALLFDDVNHFRKVLRKYAVQKGFRLVRNKNEKARVTAHCGNEGCNWRIRGTPLVDKVTYKIKTLAPDHTCVRVNKLKDVTSTWIAQKCAKKLRNQPEMNVKALLEEVKEKFGGVKVPEYTLYRARNRAQLESEGCHSEAFQKLPLYAAEVERTNPSCMVRIKRNPDNSEMFKSMFMSFSALRRGFIDGCRPYIGLDGCHLKGPYGGVLLSAIALDGNNGLFPIAIAIADGETKESWTDFLTNLYDLIGDSAETTPWTFMNDGQKGIL